MREGNLEAPDRQPLGWDKPEFYDRDALYHELERIYDICHGCRRCVSLCDSFPTLFNLVDESPTLEVDGIAKSDYMKVVDQCYLCDLCAETKCPYLPPHAWAVDFPHLMLRAKAFRFREGDTKRRDRLITSTDPIFDLLSQPGIRQAANAAAASPALRKVGALLGIHEKGPIPRFEKPFTKSAQPSSKPATVTPGERTTGKVAIYVTCYGDHNEPAVVEDLKAVLEHNGCEVSILSDARCCGMPKLELGDLEKVAKLKDANLPTFLRAIDDGFDIVAPIPSCVLMYKQELPLMFPGEDAVTRVKAAFFDPFEYLMLRHKSGLVKTEFKQPLGKIAYHVACHQRVQNIGAKTRDFLKLIPDTDVTAIERCSGHDGTYAIKAETYEKAMKIARPVVGRVRDAEPDHYGSDCPMAGRMIEHGLGEGAGGNRSLHPISMVRKAYGI